MSEEGGRDESRALPLTRCGVGSTPVDKLIVPTIKVINKQDKRNAY